MEFLLPEQLPEWVAWALVLAATLTSALTAALGVGGGVLLLAVMALVVPPAAVIPLHGMVQLGSNAGRALLTWRHLDWALLAAFAPGVVLGAWLASLFLVQLPMQTLQLTIAGFILFLCWGPRIPALALGRWGSFLAAWITTFLSMFVGATGPLVAAFVKQQHAGDAFRTVANFAASMTLQHLPKAIIFGSAGFVFADWLGLLAMMIAGGALGTWLGLKFLARRSNRHFSRLFNLLLTLLALRLIWQAFS